MPDAYGARKAYTPRQHENGTSPDGLRAVATRPRSRARRESAISSADDPTSAFVVRCWRRAELSALNAPSSAATRCAAPLPRRHARRRDAVLARRGGARRSAAERGGARRGAPSSAASSRSVGRAGPRSRRRVGARGAAAASCAPTRRRAGRARLDRRGAARRGAARRSAPRAPVSPGICTYTIYSHGSK